MCNFVHHGDESTLNSNKMQKKQYILGRTTVNYQIGTKNSIRHVSSENEAETIVCTQLGLKNKFSSRNTIQRAPKTIVCNQTGNNNKISITLDNQTKGRFAFDLEGKGMCLFQFVVILVNDSAFIIYDLFI